MPIEPDARESAAPPESHFRRPAFLGGLPGRLADGQEWALAGPREIAAAGPALHAEVAGLIAALAESEDEPERLLGEMALGICLLGANYDLSPADYRRLLDCPPGNPHLAGMQAGFRDLARRHAEALRPRAEVPVVTTGRRFRLPAFRPLRRHVAAGRSRRAC